MSSRSATATLTISSLVTSLMRAGAMFTTFDVYQLAQDYGIAVSSYGTMKPTIEREIMSQWPVFDSYTRSLATWTGSNGLQPWVYHPAQVDPSTYTPSTSQSSTSTPAISITVDPNDTAIDDDSTTPLAEYQLEELFAEIGFRIGRVLSKITTNTGF